MAGRRVANPGSAIGEAIGKLIEADLAKAITQVAESLGCGVRSFSMQNHMQSKHQIDIVVGDRAGKPIILVEPKYLRYTKHNWDKGSRLCTAHYRLRRTYPSIRKSIGILAGSWTQGSIAFIQSFGVETHRIPFDHIADVMEQYGVPFRWEEDDKTTPGEAWQAYCQLTDSATKQIAIALTEPVRQAVVKSVDKTLRSDPDAPKRIERIEVSVQTTDGEYLVYNYRSAPDAIRGLAAFIADVDDFRGLMG